MTRQKCILLVLSALLYSCQSKSEKAKNEPVEKKETLRYIASDGTGALVSFGEVENKKFVEIYSNGKRIRVHQSATDDSLRYSEHDIVITKFGDSLKIDQGDVEIKLKKAKGQ